MTSISVQEMAIRLVDFSIKIAPSYPEQLIVNFVNSYYLDRAALRKELIEEVNRYIERVANQERQYVTIEPIAWVNELEAGIFSSSVLSEIAGIGNLKNDAAQNAFDALVKPLFSSKGGVQFVPTASISTGRHSLGNTKLSPEQCRTTLGINQKEAMAIAGYLDRLSGKLTGHNPTVIDLVAERDNTKNTRFVEGDTIKVAVAPYADTLFLPALIYSVSDLVDCECAVIQFLPASFFPTPDSSEHGRTFDVTQSGNFNIGYSIHERRSSFSSAGYTVLPVFKKGITKSILTLSNPAVKQVMSHLREVTNVSFLGDFAPQTKGDSTDIYIDKDFSALNSSAVADNITPSTKLRFFEPQTLTALINLTSDEYDIINLVSSLNISAHAADFSLMKELIGITISTDAHIAAVSNGLIDTPTEPSTQIFRNFSSQYFGDVTQRKFSCLAWGGDQDGDALSWYYFTGKEGASQKEDKEFEEVVDDLYLRFRKTIRGFLNIQAENDIDQAYIEASTKARKLAAALMTPVFISQPYYYGVLTRIPAFDWFHKIVSENGHLDYVPYFQKALTKKNYPVSNEQLQSTHNVS